MTPDDLRAWQAALGYSYAQAVAALGVNSATYARMLSGESRIDRRTALACSAIAAGLEPWSVSHQARAIGTSSHRVV